MIRATIIRALGSRPVWHGLRARALGHGAATVLCYHTIGPDAGGTNGWTARRVSDIAADFDWLERHYEVVTLDEILTHGTGARPRAAITFDDGDRGLARHLPGLLRRHPLPVTIYVATEQIETGRPFWFDRVVNAHQGAGRIEVAGLGRFDLPGGPEKTHWAALGPVLEALKSVPHDAREALADEVVAQGRDEGDLGPMTQDDLKALAAHPLVTIGAHSHGHELLDRIPPEAARNSMARSRDLLRGWTGQGVDHFAWPNGNETPALRKIAANLGFVSAAALGERSARAGADRFALPRVSIGRYDSPARARLRMVGI